MRLFIAIDLPESLKKEISNKKDYLSRNMKAKFVEPENMHITLKFLGEMDKIQPFKNQIKEKISEINPFVLETANSGFFPNKQHPRVFWLGLKENNEMKRLVEKINEIPIGPKNTKNHITIARVKNLYNDIEIDINQKINVDKIKLIKSELTDEGPIYTTVEEFRL